MPRITIHIGGREQLDATISKGTPLGLLSTDAIVYVGQVSITGTATALRALADAYDAWNQREQAERDADR